jgi:endonuclease/exonuclease/phosphatase (EEP) superfamily protein YafD
MRYTLETPLGAIDLYSVHPCSPRHAFMAVRREGLGPELLDPVDEPRALAGRAEIEENTSERERQVAALAAAAATSTNLVVIAGDTNLPGLSHIYARYLASGSGAWKDGFASVGNGFGYTFPARWKYGLGPWMRLDRVLAGPGLRFLSFEVGGRGASDHCPVIAELAAR